MLLLRRYLITLVLLAIDMDEVWESIANGFPVPLGPPASWEYEMLGLRLSTRLRVAVVPIGIVNTAPMPLLRFAVPNPSVPVSRIKPRTGPLLSRSVVQVRVSELCGGDYLLDSNSEEELIDIIIVDATHTTAPSFWRAVEDQTELRGFLAVGPDDEDGPAGVAVWPCLEDLLLASASLPGRPTTLYSPAELGSFLGGGVGDVDDDDDQYLTGQSSSGPALPLRTPLIPGLDPAEVANALAAGISMADLAAFSRVAASVPSAPPPPLTGSRSPASLLPTSFMPQPKRTPAPAALPNLGGGMGAIPADFFTSLRDAIQAGMAPAAATPGSALERALGGVGGGGLDTDGIGSMRRHGRARLALATALTQEPESFTRYVDKALADAFPSRPTGSQPTMREYVEHRSRFSSYHRNSLLTGWSVAGARDALRAGRPEEALARLDVFMIALEQSCIDGGSWLMGSELLWEPEPPYVASSVSTQSDSWKRPSSQLCDPTWAEVAYYRIRDLDEWDQRKKRLIGPGGKGNPRKGAPPGAAATEDLGGLPAQDDPDKKGGKPRKRGGRTGPKGGRAPG